MLLTDDGFSDRLVADCTIPNLDETEWSLVAAELLVERTSLAASISLAGRIGIPQVGFSDSA